MKIINIGSINIDHVYGVDHFVRPGETLESSSYALFSGGKGANQSIAISRAGATVMHAGKIGPEGVWLREKLRASGVDVRLVQTVDTPTGHAVIQVDREGENAIIIHGGANRTFSESDIEKALAYAEAGDLLLLQNEINAVDRLLHMAAEREMTIAFNPAPMTDAVKTYPLGHVDIFLINEVEGEALTGENRPEAILDAMQQRYPGSRTVLTLGSAGVIYADKERHIRADALKVEAVDTTGAGDTFIGYFLAELSREGDIENSLQLAVRASALCVTREGAADSIPSIEELL